MPAFAPKVHPMTRLAEAEDPMELMADAAPGDPDYMLDCMVSELAWTGMNAHEVLGLFFSPGYPVLQQLLEYHGEQEIRERVRSMFDNLGAVRITAVVDDTVEADDDDGPELIQLGIQPRGGM